MGAKVTKKPDIEFLSFYLNAFSELGTCRHNGMAVGNIPFTAIAEYAKIYNVENFEELLYIIRVMDNKYLELLDGKRKSVPDNRNEDSRTERS